MWLEERELSKGWAEGCVLDVTLLSLLTTFKIVIVIHIFQIWERRFGGVCGLPQSWSDEWRGQISTQVSMTALGTNQEEAAGH